MQNNQTLFKGDDVLGLSDVFYRQLEKSLKRILRMDDKKSFSQADLLNHFSKTVAKKIKDKSQGIEVAISTNTKIQFKLRQSAKPNILCYSLDEFKISSLFFENFVNNEASHIVRKLTNLISEKKIKYRLI